MINLNNNNAEEIVRMLNSYAEELNNALETQDNDEDMIRYIEADIANADELVKTIEHELHFTKS